MPTSSNIVPLLKFLPPAHIFENLLHFVTDFLHTPSHSTYNEAQLTPTDDASEVHNSSTFESENVYMGKYA